MSLSVDVVVGLYITRELFIDNSLIYCLQNEKRGQKRDNERLKRYYIYLLFDILKQEKNYFLSPRSFRFSLLLYSTVRSQSIDLL